MSTRKLGTDAIKAAIFDSIDWSRVTMSMPTQQQIDKSPHAGLGSIPLDYAVTAEDFVSVIKQLVIEFGEARRYRNNAKPAREIQAKIGFALDRLVERALSDGAALGLRVDLSAPEPTHD